MLFDKKVPYGILVIGLLLQGLSDTEKRYDTIRCGAFRSLV
jgi:hypothetical protein